MHSATGRRLAARPGQDCISGLHAVEGSKRDAWQHLEFKMCTGTDIAPRRIVFADSARDLFAAKSGGGLNGLGASTRMPEHPDHQWFLIQAPRVRSATESCTYSLIHSMNGWVVTDTMEVRGDTGLLSTRLTITKRKRTSSGAHFKVCEWRQ